MAEAKKNEEAKVRTHENLVQHPTYLDCSYETIIPQKFMGFS